MTSASPSFGPRILIFDSGMGGLSVVRAMREVAPQAQLAYAADNEAFPYGDWEEGALVERMIDVLGRLIERTEPDVIIIACNTASTIGLEALREKFAVPFVGTVPAIKPAANFTKSGYVSVLATPGTVAREYTKALIDTYAYHCKVTLHGAENLAAMAEAKLNGQGVDLEALVAEVAPVFVEDFVEGGGGRTDVVVLGCTHYPLLLEELQQVAPWPVEFINPAPAIARQAMRVCEYDKSKNQGKWGLADYAMFLQEAGFEDLLLKRLRPFGFQWIDSFDNPRHFP